LSHQCRGKSWTRRPCPPPPAEQVSEALKRVLESLELPAYIMGRRWDVLAWNEAASALLGDFAAMTERERNTIWRLFTSPALHALLASWECHAQTALAQFRASADRYVVDPSFAELIDDLKRVSPEFNAWWPRHDVRERVAGLKEFNHPLVGQLLLEQTTFQVTDAPDLKLVLYTPLPEADSAAKLRQLVDATRRGQRTPALSKALAGVA